MGDVRVEAAQTASEEVVDAFARLVPQLSRSAPAPTADELAAIINDPGTYVLLARDSEDDRILGSLTLVTFPIPTGMRAWIEDVVVDRAASGHRIGEQLSRFALGLAAQLGCTTVDLTSRPSREAANHIYQKIGFELRETNVYRYES